MSLDGVLRLKGVVAMSARMMASGVVHPRYARLTAALAACFLALLIVASGAQGAPGDLTQKDGSDGCFADDNTGLDLTTCADGVALDGARSVTVSPDGKSAYVASAFSDAIAIFDRNAANGKLTQKDGSDGCIAEDNTVTGVTTCADGVALDIANSVTVSPDGTSA